MEFTIYQVATSMSDSQIFPHDIFATLPPDERLELIYEWEGEAIAAEGALDEDA